AWVGWPDSVDGDKHHSIDPGAAGTSSAQLPAGAVGVGDGVQRNDRDRGKTSQGDVCRSLFATARGESDIEGLGCIPLVLTGHADGRETRFAGISAHGNV